jgi:3-hydroxyisobutyrate dehydrogenase-like beta-hydroxyacid dehydrogenase
MRKDLSICIAEATAIGADIPLTALVDGELGELQARGDNRLDATSIIRLFADGV